MVRSRARQVSIGDAEGDSASGESAKLCFVAELKRQASVLNLAQAGLRPRKSERTRLKLLAGAALCLRSQRHDDLKISDITKAAGTAAGTFYVYFADKAELLACLMAAFADHVRYFLGQARQEKAGDGSSIYATTLAYVRLFSANRGLMRCLLDTRDAPLAFGDHDMGNQENHQEIGANPSSNSIYGALNADWNRLTASAIARQRGEVLNAIHMIDAQALGAMVDGFLTDLYVRQDDMLLSALGLSPRALEDDSDNVGSAVDTLVAERLALLWQRAVGR